MDSYGNEGRKVYLREILDNRGMGYMEMVEANRKLLKQWRFKEAMNDHRYLIEHTGDHEGHESPIVIFLYEELSMIQEMLGDIRKAAMALENAKIRWEKRYGIINDDHRYFLLSRLSYHYSRLLEVPGDGPILRQKKATIYISELCKLQQEKYGRNSVHGLINHLNLVELKILSRHAHQGVKYFLTALDIHDYIFEMALKQSTVISINGR